MLSSSILCLWSLTIKTLCFGHNCIEYGVISIISQKRQQSSLEMLSKYWYSVRNIWTWSSTVQQVGSVWGLSYLCTCRWSSPSCSVDSRRCSACHRWREDTWRSDTSHSRACSSCRATNTHMHKKAHVCNILLKENVVNTSKSNVVLWLETNDFFAHLDKGAMWNAKAAEAENGPSGSNYPPIKTWMCCWLINDQNWNERMSSIHNCPTPDVLSALPCPHSTIF